MGFVIRLGVLLLLGVVVSPPAMATPPLIAIDSGVPVGNSLGLSRTSRVLIINPATGASTFMANTYVCRLIGLARGYFGDFYALTSDEPCANGVPRIPNSLLVLNQSTSQASLVASINNPTPLPGTNEGDLAIDPITFKMYATYSPGNSNLYTLDPTTGLRTFVGFFPGGPNAQPHFSAMAFQTLPGAASATNPLLWVLDTGFPTSMLMKVNKTTSQVIATYPLSPQIPNGTFAGMDFDPDTGKLFIAAGNTLYTSNVSGSPGTLTTVGSINLPNATLMSIVGMRFLPKASCTLLCGSRFCPPSASTANAAVRICDFSGSPVSYKITTNGVTLPYSPQSCGAATMNGGPPFYQWFGGNGSFSFSNSCMYKNVTLMHPPAMSLSGDSALFAVVAYPFVPNSNGNPTTPTGGPILRCVASATGANPPCDQKSLCSGPKDVCTSKMMKGLLQCHYKAEKSGAAVDTTCLQKAHDKFDGGPDPTRGCFAKLEAKYGDACLTRDDAETIKQRVDDFVTDVVTAVDPGFPALVQNKCSAGKKKCVVKITTAVMKCHDKAAKGGVPVDPLCIQKAEQKYDGGPNPAKGCFAKLEAKGSCLTTGDSASVKTRSDKFVTDVLCELGFESANCPAPAPWPTEDPFVTPTPSYDPTPTATPTDDPTPTVTPTP